MRKLNVQCTVARHLELGIDAVINARAGAAYGYWANNLSQEDVEMRRDANKVLDIQRRVRVYQFNSRAFRRRPELCALLADRDDL